MAESKKSSQEMVTLNMEPFITPVALVLAAVIFSISFMISMRWVADSIKDIKITSGGTTTTAVDNTADTGAGTATSVTIDDVKALAQNGDLLVFGDPNSDLIFIEASDPSCPFCHIAGGNNPELSVQVGERFQYDTDGGSYIPPVREMKALVDSGDAAFVWIYTNGHGNGEVATQALYCAEEQGKFWEAHDLMMSMDGYNAINNEIQNSNTTAMADFLNSVVNRDQMLDCLDSGKYAGRISEDSAIARSLGVSGTPGFFVNETNFAGAYSFSDMKPYIDAIL